jgi:hypothetical protein
VKPIKASASGGKGDEIYFSDFRKTDPSKLRTILRNQSPKLGSLGLVSYASPSS